MHNLIEFKLVVEKCGNSRVVATILDSFDRSMREIYSACEDQDTSIYFVIVFFSRYHNNLNVRKTLHERHCMKNIIIN